MGKRFSLRVIVVALCGSETEFRRDDGLTQNCDVVASGTIPTQNLLPPMPHVENHVLAVLQSVHQPSSDTSLMLCCFQTHNDVSITQHRSSSEVEKKGTETCHVERRPQEQRGGMYSQYPSSLKPAAYRRTQNYRLSFPAFPAC